MMPVEAVTRSERGIPAREGARIVTPDQRLRVFVSSTLQELAAERAAAREAIAALRLTPVLFELGARPHPPQALYRSYLEQSELFVGLYWQSYGWIAPGETVSGIDDEYRLADGLPRLLYVKEPAPTRDPRLRAFLQRIETDGTASYTSFATAAELKEVLAGDVALVLTERFNASTATEPSSPPARGVPVPRTSFVGRESELGRIEELLVSGTRLLTLTGPGGIGKTRLAVEAVRRVYERYPDGVVFVPLDVVERAELVPTAIADALGIRALADDTLAGLVRYLRGRRVLLLLDNFEHLIAAAPVVTALLDEIPGLTVVATSRELLRLSGETDFPVPPLSPEREAVALFMERTTATHGSAELGPNEVPLVAEICRRLDGVPLAIELAAPRMRLLTPAQLLERLENRLTLTGPRDAPVRQRTLEAAIAWSYELLDEKERLLFEQLGVFHGSFSIEAAEDVVDLAGEFDLVGLLSSLLDKSIVYRLPHLGETRFAMLRLIREYALDRLAEAGELESALERFAAYYVRLAGEAEDGLRSASQRHWRHTLDLEADNCRAALSWAADRQRAHDIAALMRGLHIWFWLRGNPVEAREWLGRGLASADGIDTRERGWLLGLDGAFAVLEGDFAAAADKLTDAEALLAEAGDRRGIATVKLARGAGIAPLEGHGAAQAQLEANLATFEELDDLWGIGTTLRAMCWLRIVYDHYEDAGDLFERALTTAERLGDDFGVALALGNLAMARLAAHDVAAARGAMGRALALRRAEGIMYAADEVLDILARIEHADEEHEQAITLLAAAENLRHRLHTPLWGPMAQRHERSLAELHVAVGDRAFESAYARGATLDMNELNEVSAGRAAVTADRPTRADLSLHDEEVGS